MFDGIRNNLPVTCDCSRCETVESKNPLQREAGVNQLRERPTLVRRLIRNCREETDEGSAEIEEAARSGQEFGCRPP